MRIQSVVVVLGHLVFDNTNVLAVVEVLEDATYLIVRVGFTLLIERFRHIYDVEDTRTMMSEYVEQIATSTCQDNTMRPRGGNAFRGLNVRLTCRQHR